MASKTAPAGACGATLKSGKPCPYRSKGTHPDLGCLCGVHLRCAARRKECCICLSEVAPRFSKTLECGHEFHKRCIRKWLSRGSLTCPMCRTVCLGELNNAHRPVSTRVRHLLRVLPPPSGLYFPAYMLGLLNSDQVVQALNLNVEDHVELIGLTYQTFTLNQFLESMELLNM